MHCFAKNGIVLRLPRVPELMFLRLSIPSGHLRFGFLLIVLCSSSTAFFFFFGYLPTCRGQILVVDIQAHCPGQRMSTDAVSVVTAILT